MTRRIAYFGAAPLLSLIVFHNIFRTWFQNDDFGWLKLDETVHSSGLLYTLFAPLAQGTVRVLSERVPFLVFPALFGLHPLPFRVLAFATWIAALALAALIGTRLTGSQAGGLIAAMLWSVHATLVQPLAWASDYNEVLCAACILAAFYARLRGRRLWEWIAYLAGFGVLEVIVVYPALAMLHALCLDRKKFRGTLPLVIPAIVFTAIHLFLIPNGGGAEYQIAIDGRIGSTLVEYLKWAAGPTRLFEFTGSGRAFGVAAAAVLGISVAAFVLWRTARRDFLPLFCCGWFLLLVAPVLVLPKHLVDYALTTPMAGLSWLGAAAVLRAWRSGNFARAGAGAIAGLYLVLMMWETSMYANWFMHRSRPMQALMEGVRKAHDEHPNAVFLLQGVDDDVYQSGFEDDPFQLLGAKAYLTPGGEKNIIAHSETFNLKPWIISQRDALDLIERGDARVLNLSGASVRDATTIYRTVLHLQMRKEFVDVSDSLSSSQLGAGWYAPDRGIRWMQKKAVVKLSGPASASQRLFVTGYAPAALLAAGPVRLSFAVNGSPIGTATVKEHDARFAFDFALPQALVGQPEIEIAIEASRTFRPPGDARDLGMAFSTFAIR